MNKQKIIALLFSFVYVGLGTVTVFTCYGADKIFIHWPWYIVLLTFPVTIISQAVRFGVIEYVIPVSVIQFIMFGLVYFIIYRILKRRYLRK
jgi:hypothetical protein